MTEPRARYYWAFLHGDDAEVVIVERDRDGFYWTPGNDVPLLDEDVQILGPALYKTDEE